MDSTRGGNKAYIQQRSAPPRHRAEPSNPGDPEPQEPAAFGTVRCAEKNIDLGASGLPFWDPGAPFWGHFGGLGPPWAPLWPPRGPFFEKLEIGLHFAVEYLPLLAPFLEPWSAKVRNKPQKVTQK